VKQYLSITLNSTNLIFYFLPEGKATNSATIASAFITPIAYPIEKQL